VRWLHLDLFKLGETSVTPLSLIAFLVTVIVVIAIGRFVRVLIMRGLARGGVAGEGVGYAVGRIIQYVIVVSGILLGLDNVGVSLTALAAIGAVISVGIGFGLQNITQNFVSGVILLLERPVQKGDFVQLGQTEGEVVSIEMRATRVLTRDGISVLVPNSKLISEEVYNQSAPTPLNRILIKVATAYGVDTHLVRRILLEVAEKDGRVLSEPKPGVFFRAFGESSLDFELGAWLETPTHRPQIASDLRFAIDAAFRKHGIKAPVPQRELFMIAPKEPAPSPAPASPPSPARGRGPA
jgi:small-conductance mechanosensitive channel